MVKIKNISTLLGKNRLQDKLIEICKINEVVFIAIFGSFIRGEQREDSDIDILIRYKKNSRKSLLDLVGLENEISLFMGRKVDLLTMESISPYIKNEVFKSMKVIYEEK
ncbi:MAG: type VII toxin-antitoxin system MntA family adenylyltransferase antitoxin [Candidatus Humimicrobiaceae bacterium]